MLNLHPEPQKTTSERRLQPVTAEPFWRYFKGDLKGFVTILPDKNPETELCLSDVTVFTVSVNRYGLGEWGGKKREKEINGKTNI